MFWIGHGPNLLLLERVPSGSARLLYMDPPFNTGRKQQRMRLKVAADADGERTGFGGRRYAAVATPSASYEDSFDDLAGYIAERVQASLRCLTDDASIFVHVDYREVHYVKVALDAVLGRDSFMNEIIWAYDYGARSKSRWPTKHDNILWYARDPKRYVFNFDAMDRIAYMAPELVGEEKAARGKTPTDVWWHTIVPTNGREKTGYPTQKPLGVLERIVRVHSSEGDVVLDPFAGSGTTGEAAARHGRGFALIDQNDDAVAIMQKRLAAWHPVTERL